MFRHLVRAYTHYFKSSLAQGRMAIAEATGIDQRTLEKMASKEIKLYRRDYIDALCMFFECTPNDLIEIEPVELPLKLDLRPDRHGVRVGEKTKKVKP